VVRLNDLACQRKRITRHGHQYGAHSDQHGELFVPMGAARAGVAVVLHGGFWRNRYDRRLMDSLCEDLARAGLVAWNLEYRRLPTAGWSGLSADVAAGIDAAAELGLDLSRVVTIGHSAGGQLALWAAARRGRVRVTHAVSQAGVLDLCEAARLGLSRCAVRELLGGEPDAVPQRYAEASPAELTPLGVPQLIVHGGRDRSVPLSISREYARRAHDAGDDVELVVDARSGHYEHLDPSSNAWRTVREWIDARLS
jgi:acetyl esterase/lipase